MNRIMDLARKMQYGETISGKDVEYIRGLPRFVFGIAFSLACLEAGDEEQLRETLKDMLSDEMCAKTESSGDSPDSNPSWEDAPDWAEWLAEDKNGKWFWYADRPKRGMIVWLFGDSTRYKGAGESGAANPDWAETLERRPTAKPTWEDAPNWANWLAQDPSGRWYWYGSKPTAGETIWVPADYRCSMAGEGKRTDTYWKDTLEHRLVGPLSDTGSGGNYMTVDELEVRGHARGLAVLMYGNGELVSHVIFDDPPVAEELAKSILGAIRKGE